MTSKLSETEKDRLFKLYEILSQDNRTYNNIIWQFPTAVFTLNFLIMNSIKNHLLFLPVVDYATFFL